MPPLSLRADDKSSFEQLSGPGMDFSELFRSQFSSQEKINSLVIVFSIVLLNESSEQSRYDLICS